MVAVLHLILGCFLDSIGIMLLTMPIILPIANESGIELIYFGLILVKLLEIGLLTPPVGLNVYVIKRALGDTVSLATIFKGVTWFILTDVVTLAIIMALPTLSTYLPSLHRRLSGHAPSPPPFRARNASPCREWPSPAQASP